MVSSYLQLLRRRHRGALDSDAGELIEFAVDGATRMRGLIEDLLSDSHAGRADEPFEPVDLQRLAERVADRLRSATEPIALISVGPLPTLAGNAQGLEQLFQNLIGNAVKFVPAGRDAQVEISAERRGASWRVTVTDNGIGLDPGHADRIFGMFERLHSGDEYPGTGIGLAIARKVVTRHGGRIWAEPRAGGGSRFCFTLPGD
jgi:light-regulated signal transduction histidine kinase (bacteriophytochrome)